MRLPVIVGLWVVVAGEVVGAGGCFSQTQCSDCGPCGIAGGAASSGASLAAAVTADHSRAFVMAQWDLARGPCVLDGFTQLATVHVLDLAGGAQGPITLPPSLVEGFPDGSIALAGGDAFAVVDGVDAWFRLAAPAWTLSSAATAAPAVRVVSAGDRAFVQLGDGEDLRIAGDGSGVDAVVASNASFEMSAFGDLFLADVDGGVRRFDPATLAETGAWDPPACIFDGSMVPIAPSFLLRGCSNDAFSLLDLVSGSDGEESFSAATSNFIGDDRSPVGFLTVVDYTVAVVPARGLPAEGLGGSAPEPVFDAVAISPTTFLGILGNGYGGRLVLSSDLVTAYPFTAPWDLTLADAGNGRALVANLAFGVIGVPTLTVELVDASGTTSAQTTIAPQ